MYSSPEEYFVSIGEIKYSIDAFADNQGYVICKWNSDKNCIGYKYDMREIYKNKNCHIHKKNNASYLIGCPFVLHTSCLHNSI